MWRPRDRERFIGSYDPEREMPDPDRERGDRWQSDAYRHNARDSRFAYRLNPDRFERHFEDRRDIDRERDLRWRGDARDFRGRSDYDRGYERGYDHGYNRADYDPGFNRDYDRGGFMIGSPYDRDRGRDFDWGFDRYERDRSGGWDWDRERDWRRR